MPAGLEAVLNVAMVLLADHELAASTLAARVAASMRADPYAVVATGLGAMGGALHGGAALGAELMLASAESPEEVPRVVGDLLRRGERLPGFGHFVYKDGDPRANLLLQVVQAYAADSPRLAVASAVVAEVRRRSLPEPNIEFALAVLAAVAGMVRGAGEAIFAVSRTAGWIAHALEEYDRNIPIRPRGVYVGPIPAAVAGVGRGTRARVPGNEAGHGGGEVIDIIGIDTPTLGDRGYLATDGEVALVVDAQRDFDRVTAVAADRGVTITHVVETHIHNDYVTGGYALARAMGAQYLVNAADPVTFSRTLVQDGDVVEVGAMRVRAISTPGHTFTHLSYAISAAGDPDGAEAVFTGGSLLYGATGRTDLLGPENTEELSRAQHDSVRRLARELPGTAAVCPTHGFGSFCTASSVRCPRPARRRRSRPSGTRTRR